MNDFLKRPKLYVGLPLNRPLSYIFGSNSPRLWLRNSQRYKTIANLGRSKPIEQSLLLIFLFLFSSPALANYSFSNWECFYVKNSQNEWSWFLSSHSKEPRKLYNQSGVLNAKMFYADKNGNDNFGTCSKTVAYENPETKKQELFAIHSWITGDNLDPSMSTGCEVSGKNVEFDQEILNITDSESFKYREDTFIVGGESLQLLYIVGQRPGELTSSAELCKSAFQEVTNENSPSGWAQIEKF